MIKLGFLHRQKLNKFQLVFRYKQVLMSNVLLKANESVAKNRLDSEHIRERVQRHQVPVMAKRPRSTTQQ